MKGKTLNICIVPSARAKDIVIRPCERNRRLARDDRRLNPPLARSESLGYCKCGRS